MDPFERLVSRSRSKKLGSVRLCACGETAWAPGRGAWAAVVDAEDGHLLDDGWSVAMRGTCPASLTRNRNGRTERLHRLIVGDQGVLVVDHINGNALDNRRQNLRPATPAQNSRNRRAMQGKRFRGVELHGYNKWRARIWADGVRHDLGLFDSPESAAAAYDEAAVQLQGDFARPNRPVADHRASRFDKPEHTS
jgi:hypothetical protein